MHFWFWHEFFGIFLIDFFLFLCQCEPDWHITLGVCRVGPMGHKMGDLGVRVRLQQGGNYTKPTYTPTWVWPVVPGGQFQSLPQNMTYWNYLASNHSSTGTLQNYSGISNHRGLSWWYGDFSYFLGSFWPAGSQQWGFVYIFLDTWPHHCRELSIVLQQDPYNHFRKLKSKITCSQKSPP